MGKKVFLPLFWAIFLFHLAFPSTAFAADTVSAALPDYPVSLNGYSLSSGYSRFPFLVYKGITYLPLTFDNCRLLGLQTMWSESEGLSVVKDTTPVSEYAREVVREENQKMQTAQIMTGKITVNGKTIDNSQEPYPLLWFRGVVYLPLTWRFAVDELGWSCSFDAENGLTLSHPAVELTCAETWTGSIERYEDLTSTDGMRLTCLFDVESAVDQRPHSEICLYNLSGEDITILPGCWEYQLYQVRSGQDHLIYRKAIPFYAGELPAGHCARWDVQDTYWFWSGSYTPDGAVRAVLAHPDSISCQLAGTTLSEPIGGDSAAVSFSKVFTVS